MPYSLPRTGILFFAILCCPMLALAGDIETEVGRMAKISACWSAA